MAPVLYGINLLLCALAYSVLQGCLIRHHGRDSQLAKAVSTDFKGKASPLLYVGGIVTAWTLSAWGGIVFFVVVALMWLLPDRRIERLISSTLPNNVDTVLPDTVVALAVKTCCSRSVACRFTMRCRAKFVSCKAAHCIQIHWPRKPW